jgi:hypothetical protein
MLFIEFMVLMEIPIIFYHFMGLNLVMGKTQFVFDFA